MLFRSLTGWYQAAKHAVEAASDALRIEVAGTGVRVVVVQPGGFRTAIWDEARGDMARRRGERYREAYRRSLMGMQRTDRLMGDPARVAAVIVRAMVARRPRARRLVGYDARLFALIDRLTPTAVKDRIERLVLGL